MTFYLLESIGRSSYIEAHWQAEHEGDNFGVQGFLPLEGDALPVLISDEAAFSQLIDSEEKLMALVGTGTAIFRCGEHTDRIAEMISSQSDELLARIDPRRIVFGISANHNEVQHGI